MLQVSRETAQPKDYIRTFCDENNVFIQCFHHRGSGGIESDEKYCIYTILFVTLYLILMQFSGWEEGEDDARSACPFDILGYTHNTIAITTGRDEVTLS